MMSKSMWEEYVKTYLGGEEKLKEGGFLTVQTIKDTPVIYLSGVPTEEVWIIEGLERINRADITFHTIKNLL